MGVGRRPQSARKRDKIGLRIFNLDSWYSYKICYAQRYNAEFKGTRLYHWKSIYQLIKIKESEYIE